MSNLYAVKSQMNQDAKAPNQGRQVPTCAYEHISRSLPPCGWHIRVTCIHIDEPRHKLMLIALSNSFMEHAKIIHSLKKLFEVHTLSRGIKINF